MSAMPPQKGSQFTNDEPVIKSCPILLPQLIGCRRISNLLPALQIFIFAEHIYNRAYIPTLLSLC